MKETYTLQKTFLPELGIPRRGKVRDIYWSDDRLTLVTSDRVSIFDQVLSQPVRDKGRILNAISRFWFEQTADIIPNHLLAQPDPNVMVVRRCKPIPLEIIVRGYLVGSLWRDYAKGVRVKCGVTLPDGLQENDPLPTPILTPTTKSHEGHDEDITKDEILKQGIISEALWNKIETTAFALFQRGTEILKQRGMILLDTKYEFGIDTDGDLRLIDEIHTPDSSRFWYVTDREKKLVRYPDKEMLREWSRKHGVSPKETFPEEILTQASQNYREIYQSITNQPFLEEDFPPSARLLKHLKKEGMIKGCYCLVISGSERDREHVEKIGKGLQEQEIPWSWTVSSAHKHTPQLLELLQQYEDSLEPVVLITVAGRSNALSGVVASHSKWPVIAAPPFKDQSDYLVNIHSTLQMPSNVPVMTVVDPGNAALAAARILKAMEVNR